MYVRLLRTERERVARVEANQESARFLELRAAGLAPRAVVAVPVRRQPTAQEGEARADVHAISFMVRAPEPTIRIALRRRSEATR